MRIAVRRLGYVLLGTGVACGLSCLVLFASTRRFAAHALRARGVIVSIADHDERAVYPNVQFLTAENKRVTFVPRTSMRPSRFRVGKKMRVLYSPAAPDRARLDSFRSLWSRPLLLGVLGLLSAVAGTWIVMKDIRTRSRLRWVKKHGRPVATEFHTVIVNRKVTRHGEHPYRIVTRWKNLLTGIHYTFTGPDIWFDPERYAARRPVIVRIDPRDPTCYDMDVSFLPSQPPDPKETDAREPVAGAE
ncbi:MAG: DUF3592 domain-containing protein [Lentisphaerae bacterium]|nr:DUF3592 domain-containing protein [Lentisphaerota bacterium]